MNCIEFFLCLCCIGIGVTPIFSLAQSLLQLHRHHSNSISGLHSVHIIWICRSNTPFTEWNNKLLQELSSENIFHIHLYCTNSRISIKKQANSEDPHTVLDMNQQHAQHSDYSQLRSSASASDYQSTSSSSTAVSTFSSFPQIIHGRPNLEELFQQISSTFTDNSSSSSSSCTSSIAGVVVCGPKQLITNVQSITQQQSQSWLFHSETFAL